jgi:hypothetical protein
MRLGAWWPRSASFLWTLTSEALEAQASFRQFCPAGLPDG